MDNFSFASLAYVRILLLPIGLIPQASFESYAAEIRSFESIRLGELPTDTKDGKAARFLPNPLSTGHLHISFPTHPPPQSHTLLSLLRPSHFPLAVIGIAKSTQVDSLPSLYSQFNTSLVDIFPHGGLFPLAKNCFVFEESDGTTNPDPGENMPGLVVVPSIANRKLHIGTLLGVLCSRILAELGVLAQALESPLGNEYLNSSLMPSLPPLSDLPSPLNSLSKNETPPTLPSHNSQPDVSRPFTLNAAPTIKRHASTATTNIRQPNLAVQTQKKRLSTIGTSSSHGRLYKMLGDFFLLAGRTEDATIWYNEAAQLFRNSHDLVWHACTLEGIATAAIIDAWSTGQGLHNSAAAIREPWIDVGDRLQQAAALFLRTPAPDGEQMHSLLAFLYSGCVLRHSSLLFAVWSAKGWGPLAFTTMLQPGLTPCIPPTLIQEGKDNWLNLERLSLTTGITRSSISSVLTQLHGPWLLHLGPRERITVLENMASLYACLGYKRKEAYILREVLGCLLDLMVCGREEDGYSQPSSVPVSAGLGIHNYHPGGWGTVGVRVSESAAGNDSILKLLTHICRVLGINLEAVALEEADHLNPVDRPPSLNDYDEDIIEELREPCGWPELQVGVVREAVAVAEALPDFPAVAQFALSSLKTLQVVLSSADQYHLYSTATRALMTAHRRGDSRVVEYWSGRPIISISIAPLPAIRLPVEKPRSIRNKPNDPKPLLQGLIDPFLYNPRKVGIDKGKALVVQNDPLELVVTLQNPYVFDLELQELSLSTSGIRFETQPIRVVIPANSLHQVVLSGKALEPGMLIIRGCFVIAPGGMSREYILPLYTVEEEQRLARKRCSIMSENGRSKYAGLDRHPWTTEQKRTSTYSDGVISGPSFRFLECKVVPEQPLLRIRRTSVTHGGLMLYDGERSVVRVTLENVSPITVDFLRFGFEDSTMEPAQKALAEGNLSVFDTYETEHSLVNKPVFSWDQRETKIIAPNQNLTLTLSCFGKVGCTNGVIHISYAHVEAANSEDSDVFYMRQVSYPLMVTVYHMLECSSMDILAFPSYSHSHRGRGDCEAVRAKHLNIEEEAGWCLFSVEVRNSYGSPFDVTLVRTQEGESSVLSTTTIAPGSLSRLVIPIRKIVLSEETLSRSIPTLSDRQFVVAHSSLSYQERRAQRELFWYREELFKCVRGRWHETGGTRSGELSFRAQRMTLHMLETFRLEIAQIDLSLDLNDNPVVVHTQRHPRPNEFICLRVKVTNLSAPSMVFTMDLDVNPPDYVIHEGVITDLAIGRLKNGESREITTSLCFLASGRFDISAVVHCFGTSTSTIDSRTARAHTTATVMEMK